MPKEVSTRSPIRVTIHAAHRNGICEKCNIRMEVKDLDIGEGKIRKRAVCPECGGILGQLIARPTSIQAPSAPNCTAPKCLWKFVIDSLFVGFVSSYHRRRVAYAERNRPERKKIAEKYRTGEPAPETLLQAIYADLKLKLSIY